MGVDECDEEASLFAEYCAVKTEEVQNDVKVGEGKRERESERVRKREKKARERERRGMRDW